MSVEAAPPPAEAYAPARKPYETALNQIVALLKEQNELLRQLVEASQTRADSKYSAEEIAYAKTVAASIQPSEEAQFVAVDFVTRRHATGPRAAAAAEALGSDTPAHRILALRTGGRLSRL